MATEGRSAKVEYWDAINDPYDGPGWYYYDRAVPQYGGVGAFKTREAAEAHAREAGFTIEGGGK